MVMGGMGDFKGHAEDSGCRECRETETVGEKQDKIVRK
jgi:hypothetical protein